LLLPNIYGDSLGIDLSEMNISRNDNGNASDFNINNNRNNSSGNNSATKRSSSSGGSGEDVNLQDVVEYIDGSDSIGNNVKLGSTRTPAIGSVDSVPVTVGNASGKIGFWDYVLPTFMSGSGDKFQGGDMNIWGDVFVRPGAAVRSALLGDGYVNGALNPQEVPSFGDVWANKYIQSGGDNPWVGVPIVMAGMVGDMVTNPADVLLTITGGKLIQSGGKAIASTKLGKMVLNTRSMRMANVFLKRTLPRNEVYKFLTQPRSYKAVFGSAKNRALNLINKGPKPKFSPHTRDRAVRKNLKKVLGDLKKHNPTHYEHSKNTADIVRKFAKNELKLSPREVKMLHRKALLHDAGKLKIRNSLLNKTGKLTDAEFAEMAKHTSLGDDVLREYKVLQRTKLKDAFSHHEKLSGKGYPKGLTGDEITRDAKILALGDSMEVMTAERSYKTAKTISEALKGEKGIVDSVKFGQFDKKLADRFVNYWENAQGKGLTDQVYQASKQQASKILNAQPRTLPQKVEHTFQKMRYPYSENIHGVTVKDGRKIIGNKFDPNGPSYQVGVDPRTIKPGDKSLKTVQKIGRQRINKINDAMNNPGGKVDPVVLSQDGTIRDGHHRVVEALENGRSIDIIKQ
ncbi:MAG: HD domain-containing protein, partial [Spirochaetes bacterium]|nr:HD domain-containing protein [Spirochaetota bacterium]